MKVEMEASEHQHLLEPRYNQTEVALYCCKCETKEKEKGKHIQLLLLLAAIELGVGGVDTLTDMYDSSLLYHTNHQVQLLFFLWGISK